MPPTNGMAQRAYSRKYLIGSTQHPSTHYTSLPEIDTSKSLYRRIDASRKYLAIALSGPGGRLLVHERRKTGRLTSTAEPLIHGSLIQDFELERDPEEGYRVVVGCADGRARVWTYQQTDPLIISGTNTNRILKVSWHPTVRDLVFLVRTNAVEVWNISGDIIQSIEFEKSVVDAAWSDDGHRVGLVFLDNSLQLSSLTTGKLISLRSIGHTINRGCRVRWLGNDHLCTTGFGRGSIRQVCLYSVNDLGCIDTLSLETSPSNLFPYFDEQTSILYLAGRGDRQVGAAYFNAETLQLELLPSLETTTLHSDLVFLDKRELNIKQVEVSAALRLTDTTIEQISFRIPRSKTDYFQDDIFIPVPDIECRQQTTESWLNGDEYVFPTLSLRSPDVQPLSEAPATNAADPSQKKRNIMQKRMTQEEEEQQSMDEMFARAKNVHLSDDEADRRPATASAGYEENDWD